MQKFLRTLMLAALMLPFVSNAQSTLTVADGTTTNSYVPVYGFYVDDFVRCQTIYPASMLTSMNGESVLGVTYYLSTPAAASWGVAQFVVNVMEVPDTTLTAFVDMTNATTVYTGSLDATQPTMEIEFNTPYTYQGGNLLIEIYNTLEGTYKSASFYGITADGASWRGNNGTSVAAITGSVQNFIPKTTFAYGNPPTCFKVTNVTASDITSSGMTLTWTDALNTSATYTVYDMSDTSDVYATVTGNTATITGLTPNTAYTFGVQTDCGAGDIAAGYALVNTRTACAAMSLPFTEGFESVPTGSYQMPFCWSRYTSAYTSSAIYPYSYTSGAHDGSRSLYFYGATTASYPDTMVAILPEMDVTTYPMNANRVTFWAKMGAATNSKSVYVGTMTDPTDMSTFVLVDSVLVSGNTYDLHSVSLTSASATAPYVALMVMKGTGTMYIDDVTLEELPSCFEVSSLAIVDSLTTTNSITLTWNDANNTGATYTVYNMSDTLEFVDYTVNGTTAVVSGLNPSTSYIFGVQANCATDDAAIMTVSGRTACGAMSLPFVETFDVTVNSNPCWNGATKLVSEVFAGEPLTLTTPQWTYASTDRDGLTGAHYYKNVYGTSCMSWIITPEIDLSTATAPMLSFDAAFTKWNAATPAEGDITDDQFLVIVSTDGGQTWLSANATAINLTTLIGNTYVPQYVDLSAFVGDTIRIAFYAESTVAGGDNDLHIDNLSVSESTGDICLPIAGLNVDSVTANTVSLSWTGTAASYEIYNDTVLVGATTSTAYDVTGLDAQTGYTFGVVAVCSESSASSMVTISTVTACDGATCEINVYAEDSYGDGWNGAILEVKQNGFAIANYTMLGQDLYNTPIYDTFTVEVCAASPVELQWFAGNYDDEISFMIADYNGDSLYYVEDASDLIDGATFFNLTAPCGEVEADSLTVVLMVNDSTLGSITPAVGVYRLALGDSITLTATPYGDNVFNGWLTYVDGEVMATLPFNPFTFSANVNNVNHTMLMVAQFAAAGAAPDSVTVIINVDNPLMGTTSPAPGTYRVAVGDPLDMVALPNAGFHNLYWIESATLMGTTFTDTLAYDTLNFFASPIMANATLNYTAYFEADPPVESTISADEINYWVGTGSNQVVIAVNWADDALAWGVRFNGESITVQDALDSMVAYDHRFNYVMGDWGLGDITFNEPGMSLSGVPGSYWESKHNGVMDMGLAQTLVDGDFEKWAEPAAGIVTDSMEYGGVYYYTYTYTMPIVSMWAPIPQQISITFTVNDVTMGDISPRGLQTFLVGEEFTVTATPAQGCSFVSWSVTTAEGQLIILERNMLSFTDTIEAEWDGSTLAANFERNEGIDDVENADFQAYSVNGKVVVRGVENMDVNIYDVTGRNVKSVAKATETVEVTVPTAGVYMVKVGSVAKRVVVIR